MAVAAGAMSCAQRAIDNEYVEIIALLKNIKRPVQAGRSSAAILHAASSSTTESLVVQDQWNAESMVLRIPRNSIGKFYRIRAQAKPGLGNAILNVAAAIL